MFALLLLSSSYLLADQPAAQQAQQQQEKRHRVAELDRLIKAIHLDLKRLQKDNPWLVEYTDKCLLTDKGGPADLIYYMPIRSLKHDGKSRPQQEDHISITYCRLGENNEKGGKYWNVLEDVPVCRFPSLRSKIYAEILLRGDADAKTADAIRTCIIKQCCGLQKKMEREKAANPQQNNGGFQGSRKRS